MSDVPLCIRVQNSSGPKVRYCSFQNRDTYYIRTTYLQAEKKGMDVSHAGYVFSFYALVMFLTAPFFGKIVSYFLCIFSKFISFYSMRRPYKYGSLNEI